MIITNLREIGCVTTLAVPDAVGLFSRRSVEGRSQDLAWLAGESQVIQMSSSKTAKPLLMQFIDLAEQQRQTLSDGRSLRDHINSRIAGVLDHGRYILGPGKLEVRLANYVGVEHCIAVASGTDALLIALLALGIKAGDEVITTPFSFIATSETIGYGCDSVYVDIDPLTHNAGLA